MHLQVHILRTNRPRQSVAVNDAFRWSVLTSETGNIMWPSCHIWQIFAFRLWWVTSHEVEVESDLSAVWNCSFTKYYLNAKLVLVSYDAGLCAGEVIGWVWPLVLWRTNLCGLHPSKNPGPDLGHSSQYQFYSVWMSLGFISWTLCHMLYYGYNELKWMYLRGQSLGRSRYVPHRGGQPAARRLRRHSWAGLKDLKAFTQNRKKSKALNFPAEFSLQSCFSQNFFQKPHPVASLKGMTCLLQQVDN